MRIRQTLAGGIIRQRCPRCREGRIFTDSNPYHLRNLTKMPENCNVCGQLLTLEPGFYYGSMYVSYALCVAIFMINFMWIGFFIEYKGPGSVLPFSIVNTFILAVLMPFIFRLARVIYLNFFVKYDKKFISPAKKVTPEKPLPVK